MPNDAKSLTKAIQEMVLRHDLSVEQICDAAFEGRKSHWTLYKELNPQDESAKIGAVDLVDLMRVCRDVAPLRIMASRLGQVLMPLPAAAAACPQLETAMSQATKEFADAVLCFSALMADGVVTRCEYERFAREIDEFLAAAVLWREEVHQRMQESCPQRSCVNTQRSRT